MGVWGALRGRKEQVSHPTGAVGAWAAAGAPTPEVPLSQVELLALDIETTGLDPRRDEVLSIGYVPVLGGEVVLAGARGHRVRPEGDVGDSALVHGLTDDALAQSPVMTQVLPEVLGALTGGTEQQARRRVLVAHFAQIETDFLAAACRTAYGIRVRLPVIDTLRLERRLLRGRTDEPPAGRLRLDACRRAHGLPRYTAHDALTDAIACAELFLAQCAQLQERLGRPLTLSDVMTPGRD